MFVTLSNTPPNQSYDMLPTDEALLSLSEELTYEEFDDDEYENEEEHHLINEGEKWILNTLSDPIYERHTVVDRLHR